MVDVGMENADDDPHDYHLIWTTHVEVFLRVMQALRHKELFADATLICGKKRYEVHQFVLSTCSLYLENLFKCMPDDHPVLMVPDAPPRAMEQLLDFMYLGQTDLTSEDVGQLLELAEELKIKGLVHTSSNSEDQDQISSVDQEDNKETIAINMGGDETTVEETPKKTTRKKISRACKKNIFMKSIIAKKSKKTEDQVTPHVCKLCRQHFKTSKLFKNHMKFHCEKKLFSCPECPFRALTARGLNQHINKHSVGNPYICPHCQLRHPLEELHIAHQKKNHPKMKIVINKSPVEKLEESVNTGLESGVDHSVMNINNSLQTAYYVSPVSFPSPIQQTCKEDQAISSQPPSNSVNCDSNTLSYTKVSHASQMSVVKTEVLPQALESTRSELSTLSSSGPFTVHTDTVVSPNKTMMGDRKRKLSPLGEKVGSNFPLIKRLSIPLVRCTIPMNSTNYGDPKATIIPRRSTRLKREMLSSISAI